MDHQSYLYSGTLLIRSPMPPPPPSNLAVLTGDHTNKGFFFGGGIKENVWLFCKAAKKKWPGQYLLERMLSDHFHHFHPQGVTVEEAVEAI